MLFGERMQKLREEKGISQKELAEMLGVTTGRVAELESCEAIPGVDEIERIKHILFKTAEKENKHIENEKNEFQNKAGSNKKFMTVAFVSIALLVAAIAVILISVFNTPFSKNTRAIAKADASVVKIIAYNSKGERISQGSGFVAFDRTTVVTNYHVMEDAYTADILASDDCMYEIANVINFSEELDLAILSLKESGNMKPLKLGSSKKMKKGETVTAIGCPVGIRNVVSQGVLSTRNQLEYMNEIQFTAPISHGSSGGALFDEKGKIIGITYAGRDDGQNLNFAIPVEELKKLYSQAGELLDANAVFLDAHKTYPHRDKYKDLKEYNVKIARWRWNLGETMKIKGCISSYGPKFPGSEEMVYFISMPEECTGDFDYDLAEYDDYRRGSHVIKVLETKIVAKDKVQVGDAVTIVGDPYQRYGGQFDFDAYLICKDE